jgi:hypothetical protein
MGWVRVVEDATAAFASADVCKTSFRVCPKTIKYIH